MDRFAQRLAESEARERRDDEAVLTALRFAAASYVEVLRRLREASSPVDAVAAMAALHRLQESGVVVRRGSTFDLVSRLVLAELADGPRTTAEISARLSVPEPVVSRTLTVLLGQLRAARAAHAWRAVAPGEALASASQSAEGIRSAVQAKRAAGAAIEEG